MIKNDDQYKYRLYKIIIPLQIKLAIALFSMFEHSKCIALIKMLLGCAAFHELWL